MTRAKKANRAGEGRNALTIDQQPHETAGEATARKLIQPQVRHSLSASSFASKVLGSEVEAPELMDYMPHVHAMATGAAAGDVGFAHEVLAARILTLDSMFTEFARRAAPNMGEYLDAAERYARLGMKAQSNCKATVETLAKLHQPREQTVKHVHVNEGGQAVVADHFHHHAGGHRNAETAKQPDAARTGSAGSGPAMLGHDAQENGLPIPGDQGRVAMPNARRQGQRRP